MTVRDTRPRLSVMPAHLLAVLEKYQPDLERILAGVFDDVMASEGSPAELQNDALSMMSQLSAIVTSIYIAKVAEAKAIPLGFAATIAMPDLELRLEILLSGIQAIAAAKGATRQ